MDVAGLSELYQARFEQRQARLKSFYDPKGSRRFLILQRGEGFRWGTCNSVEEVVRNNLRQLESELQVEWNDDLPYLEPWVGTGVYANAFGCEYVFRPDAAPHVHYKYMKIEELKGVPYPDWRKSPIMRMVLDCIDALKEASGGRIPIAMTDTQSAFDTATLILDAAEFFASCYLEEEIVMDFMVKINDLVIEFSHEQAKRIGPQLLARPGHIMPSFAGGPGISVSDDNLAVSSPTINERISLPFDKRLAEEFGGIAIHSCGVWSHTMKAAAEMGGTLMIDCAMHRSCDPNPNQPAAIRDALKGTGVIAKIRLGGEIEEVERLVKEVFDPSIKFVFQIPLDEANGERNYKRLSALLEKLYGGV